MIPPLQASRLRAIERWLLEGGEVTRDDCAFAQLVADLDARMIEAFDARSSELQYAMMRRHDSYTDEALAEFRMAQLTLWGEIFETFLPCRD